MRKTVGLLLLALSGLCAPPVWGQAETPRDSAATVGSVPAAAVSAVPTQSQGSVPVTEGKPAAGALAPGIYLLDAQEHPAVSVEPAPFTLRKSGGGTLNGVTGGVGGTLLNVALGGVGGLLAGKVLATSSVKTEQIVLPGPSSGTLLTVGQAAAPRFLFSFAPAADTLQADSARVPADVMAGTQTPADFRCVRLDAKKDRRTLPKKMQFSSLRLSTGDVRMGGNSLVDFRTDDLGGGRYVVSFDGPLEPGEYCFLFKDLGQSTRAGRSNAFAFTVPARK